MKREGVNVVESLFNTGIVPINNIIKKLNVRFNLIFRSLYKKNKKVVKDNWYPIFINRLESPKAEEIKNDGKRLKGGWEELLPPPKKNMIALNTIKIITTKTLRCLGFNLDV